VPNLSETTPDAKQNQSRPKESGVIYRFGGGNFTFRPGVIRSSAGGALVCFSQLSRLPAR
jgi:hypothetical protein